MNSRKELILVLFIFLLALALRIYQLGIVPPSPDWDEAAIGYNAYSLLKTGRDEYGKFLPIVFRSFDDYKPPVYFYLAIPSIAIFGLNVFAVRLPSAILGSLTVLITYFLVKRLFADRKSSNKTLINSSLLAFISALLLAISPWHLQFSRVAFETNIALFFNVTGVWLFLEGLKKPKIWLISALFFALAPYSYHSARVFTPLLILGLFIVFRADIFKQRKWTIISGLIFSILMLPLILTLLSPEGRLRLSGVSALADQTNILTRDIKKIQDDNKNNFLPAKLFHNRRITYALIVITGYLRHFDLNWLFLNGDIPRHHAPGVGILYLWELPFLFIGIYQLIFNEKKARNILVWWILIAPIAAAPTVELPHAVRTLTFLPTFQIITAYGLIFTAKYILARNVLYKISMIPYIIFIVFNIIYYFHQYYIHLSIETSQYWQYGYEQAVVGVKKVYNQYNKIIVSTKLEQSHMFFLFYLRYDPQKYLQEGGSSSGGFKEKRNGFAKFEFRPLDIDHDQYPAKTLLVGTPDELTIGSIETIYNLDGSEAIKLVER
ncbi:MAG: glycosyltransferase family 39 protein [Candidatus Gottesmanbacteria bacterium]